MTLAASTQNIEAPIIEQIDCLLTAIRSPCDDVIEHVQKIEPLIDEVARQWSAANIDAPSGGLLGRARALRIEYQNLQLRLRRRGKILARIQREIQEVSGGTYGRGAQRISTHNSRRREKSL